MANNPLARHGGLTYLHIPATHPRRSAEFYASLLGWKIEERKNGAFRFADREGLLIGGFGQDEAAQAPGLLCYFYVDDIAAAVGRVGEGGGAVVEPPTLQGDTHVARVRDPDGNVIGLWQFAP